MNCARVRACKARTWDGELGAWVSRVYGYRAETVEEAVGKVHNSYRDALLDARAYNRTRQQKSPSAAETA